MSEIGHNNPPDMKDTANDVASALNEWLGDHPVIEGENDAKEAKNQIDRAKLCLADLTAERRKQTDPLNEKIKTINDHYRVPFEVLTRVSAEVERRIKDFLRREEQAREAAAREAARIVEERERAARLAEENEREALRSANSGVLDVNIHDVVVQADDAFAEYEKASRFAARAERDTKVKVTGGLGRRATSLRTKTIYVLGDAVKAIISMGVSEALKEAILKDARSYHKVFEELPEGVTIEIERN